MHWICIRCGAEYSADEPVPNPATCGDCGSVALRASARERHEEFELTERRSHA